MTSEFLQFTLNIDMFLKRAKCDLNGVKIATFATKLKNHPAAGGYAPFVTRLSCNGLFSTGPKLDNFGAKDIYFWFKLTLSQQNPGCASSRIHSCRQIFQAIIGAAYETS